MTHWSDVHWALVSRAGQKQSRDMDPLALPTTCSKLWTGHPSSTGFCSVSSLEVQVRIDTAIACYVDCFLEGCLFLYGEVR